MSRSSRTLNRSLLVILGLSWLATGALLVLANAWPELLAPLEPAFAGIAALPLDWPIVLAIAGAALLVLALLHSTTRGRGRTADAAVVGGIALDRDAVRDVFRHELGDLPDVLDASVQPWRLRRGRAWRIAVTVRHGARLDDIVDRAAAAAERTRTRLGVQTPVVLHLGGGIRAAVASTRRAA